MTDEQIIAKQARRIAVMEAKLVEYDEARRAIHSRLYSIGAPLNDNVMKFGGDVQKFLHDLATLLPDEWGVGE